MVWQKTGGRIKHQLLFCYFASVPAEGIKFSWQKQYELWNINLALVLAEEFQIPVLRQALSVISYFNDDLRDYTTYRN